MYTVPLFLNCLATLLEKWDKKIQSFFVFSESFVSRIWFSDLHKLQRFVISATGRYIYIYYIIHDHQFSGVESGIGRTKNITRRERESCFLN